jgi:hypothetical protein
VFSYWLVSRGQLLRAIKVGYSLPVPIVVLLHVLLFLIGLGVVNFKSWGYRWFKAFLYVLLLCFPIGTIVAYVMLGYMARHHTEQYFGLPTDSRKSTLPLPTAGLLAIVGAMIVLYLWMMLTF